MTGTLRCGFCQRPWGECERDVCPERALITTIQQALEAGRERERAHARELEAARAEGYEQGYQDALASRVAE